MKKLQFGSQDINKLPQASSGNFIVLLFTCSSKIQGKSKAKTCCRPIYIGALQDIQNYKTLLHECYRRD